MLPASCSRRAKSASAVAAGVSCSCNATGLLLRLNRVDGRPDVPDQRPAWRRPPPGPTGPAPAGPAASAAAAGAGRARPRQRGLDVGRAGRPPVRRAEGDVELGVPHLGGRHVSRPWRPRRPRVAPPASGCSAARPARPRRPLAAGTGHRRPPPTPRRRTARGPGGGSRHGWQGAAQPTWPAGAHRRSHPATSPRPPQPPILKFFARRSTPSRVPPIRHLVNRTPVQRPGRTFRTFPPTPIRADARGSTTTVAAPSTPIHCRPRKAGLLVGTGTSSSDGPRPSAVRRRAPAPRRPEGPPGRPAPPCRSGRNRPASGWTIAERSHGGGNRRASGL